MTTQVKAPAAVFAEACAAAQAAYEDEQSRLRPMIVEGGGRRYFVSGGACGFAWVTIKPARGQFVAWLKSNHLGSSAYGGGWQLWSSACVLESRSAELGQSMQLKEAACHAFAEVLRSYGLNAYAGSRMD